MPATDAAATPTASTGRASARTLALLGVVALAVYGLDQLAKYLILKNLVLDDQVDVLGKILQFHLVKNSGAAFSLGAGYTWIFAIIASLVAIFIVVFARRIRSFAWTTVFGLLLGGTIGNLNDRLFREPGFGIGHVVDFLQIYAFPAIFNLADIAVCSAMVLFVILTLRGIGLDGRRAAGTKAAEPIDVP